IAMAALFSAFHVKVKAIATLTQSGSTSLWMSRLNSGVPIYALTPEVRTRYKLSMYRGVTPLMIKLDPDADRDRMLIDAEAELLRSGA
ncbi:pyruvate kinase alpha/beta domain-containing protein, partial [Acinetobacter baumannii]